MTEHSFQGISCMRVRTILTEDYTNYKLPAMLVGVTSCDFKCCTEGGFSPSVCINHQWADGTSGIKLYDDDYIISEYIKNPITHAFVFGLFEPFLQYDEIKSFISKLRHIYKCNDDVVIYTGYTEAELSKQIEELSGLFSNIIVKFGRYIPGHKKHYDEVLGVYLASDNQYAKRIS